MMTEVSLTIQTTRGVGTRYIQTRLSRFSTSQEAD